MIILSRYKLLLSKVLDKVVNENSYEHFHPGEHLQVNKTNQTNRQQEHK